MFRFYIALIAGFLGAGCRTDSASPEQMITRFMTEGNIPGLFVAVVRGNDVLYQKSFGMADEKKKIPLTDKTCMELGSISKAFTAEIIYALNGRKLIGMDDPITKFFPAAPHSWSGITINHLLAHSSGIQNYLMDARFKAGEYFQGVANPVTKHFFNTITTDSMVQMFYSLPVEFKPGTTWSYSNTGYYLLGKVAESVTGKSYFELLEEHITVPLQMEKTIRNESALEEGSLATGYYKTGHRLKPSYALRSNYAFSAGGLATTGDDMTRYLKAIHQRRLPSDKVGYQWRSLQSNSEFPFSYEGGRFHTTYHGMKIISHQGGTPGFSSSWFYVVDKKISIVVLINRQDYAAIDQLAMDILAFFEPALSYSTQKQNGLEEDKYAATLMQVLNAIKFNKPYPDGISKLLKHFLESESGKGLWNWYFERGFPERANCVDAEVVGSFNIYRFRLPFADTLEYRLTMVVNSKNEIVQVRWW